MATHAPHCLTRHAPAGEYVSERDCDCGARIDELDVVWRPISTLPTAGQALVASDDDLDADGYGDIDIVCCPITDDNRLLCQTSGNYVTNPTQVWQWWRPMPSKSKQNR